LLLLFSLADGIHQLCFINEIGSGMMNACCASSRVKSVSLINYSELMEQFWVTFLTGTHGMVLRRNSRLSVEPCSCEWCEAKKEVHCVRKSSSYVHKPTSDSYSLHNHVDLYRDQILHSVHPPLLYVHMDNISTQTSKMSMVVDIPLPYSISNNSIWRRSSISLRLLRSPPFSCSTL
jgi:hypothetical protein